jgi:hypothetical protein
MTVSTSSASPFGIIGVFLVLLGAGVILDANWFWRGAAVVAIGLYCVCAPSRERSAT